MTEYVREQKIKVNCSIETNKDTYKEEFDLDDFDSLDDMFDSVREWYESLTFSLVRIP